MCTYTWKWPFFYLSYALCILCIFFMCVCADLENEYVPHRTHKLIPHKEQNAIKDAISTCYNTEQ